MINSLREYGYRAFNQSAEIIALLTCMKIETAYCDAMSMKSYFGMVAEQAPTPLFRIIYDERLLGFLSYGRSRVSEEPIAVIVSTDEGLANLAPALMEARGHKNPMVIISADIANDMNENGSGCSTHVDPILANFCEYVPLDLWNPRLTPSGIAFRVIKAYERAEMLRKPLHIRLTPQPGLFCEIPEIKAGQPIFENFDERVVTSIMEIQEEMLNCFTSYHFSRIQSGTAENSDAENSVVSEALNENLNSLSRNMTATDDRLGLLRHITDSRTLVIAGSLNAEEAENVRVYLERTGFQVYADIQSNLRGSTKLNYIADFDAWYRNHQPSSFINRGMMTDTLPMSDSAKVSYGNLPYDYILVLGGRFISKSVLEFLSVRKKNVVQVFMNDSPYNMNAGSVWGVSLNESYDVLPYIQPADVSLRKTASVFESRRNSGFESIEDLKKRDMRNEADFFRLLNDALPQKPYLFLGNSTAVRMADRYLNVPNTVFTSRTVSGIDGQIATAAGIAFEHPTVAIIGDTTALYDLSALPFICVCQLKVVVLNNNGGRIFERFPVASEKMLNTSFINPHGMNFYHFCKSFRIRYACVTNYDELFEILNDRSVKHCLIEVDLTRNQAVKKYVEAEIEKSVNTGSGKNGNSSPAEEASDDADNIRS